MRCGETEYDWFPEWGNFTYWLVQRDSVPGGKTIPLRRAGSAPEGRYGLRTARATTTICTSMDDGYLFGGTNAVTITVTYLDQGHDAWELHFDSVSSGIYKVAGAVQKNNTGTWQRATFSLADARMENRGAGSTDFRLWDRADGDETIHMVQVMDHKRPIPTPFPTATPTSNVTPTPTPTRTPTPPVTPIPPPVDCPRVPAALALDGSVAEWQGRPSIMLDRTTAGYIASGIMPDPADLSAQVWCGWQGNDLVFAAAINDTQPTATAPPSGTTTASSWRWTQPATGGSTAAPTTTSSPSRPTAGCSTSAACPCLRRPW